jgi:hypothetical protein
MGSVKGLEDAEVGIIKPWLDILQEYIHWIFNHELGDLLSHGREEPRINFWHNTTV